MHEDFLYESTLGYQTSPGMFLPHLPVAGDVLGCLDGNKVYTMSDELGLLSYEFFELLEATYFYDSWEVQSGPGPGQRDMFLDYWRELKVYHEGLLKLKSHVKEKRYLYDIFKSKSDALTEERMTRYNNKGIYYSEDIFYNKFRSFFDFCIRYWSSIEHGIQCMKALNKDSSYSYVETDTLHTIHSIGMKYGNPGLDMRHLPVEARRGVVLPFSLSFEYAGAKVMFQSMGNISQEKFRELQLIALRNKEEFLRQEEMRTQGPDYIEF